MATAGHQARSSGAAAARRTWDAVRWYVSGVLGGSKYEGYLAWQARHGTGAPMSEKEYWRHLAAHEEAHPEGRCC